MVTKEMTFKEAGFTGEIIDVNELLEFRRKQKEINEFNIKNIKAGDYIRFQLTIFDFDPDIPNKYKPIFSCGIVRIVNIEKCPGGSYAVIGKDELDLEITVYCDFAVVEKIEDSQLVKGGALRIFSKTEYGVCYRDGNYTWGYEDHQNGSLLLLYYDPELEEHILNSMLITGEY